MSIQIVINQEQFNIKKLSFDNLSFNSIKMRQLEEDDEFLQRQPQTKNTYSLHHQNDRNKKVGNQPSFFKDILILLQISVILFLIFCIFWMGLLIYTQVDDLWIKQYSEKNVPTLNTNIIKSQQNVMKKQKQTIYQQSKNSYIQTPQKIQLDANNPQYDDQDQLDGKKGQQFFEDKDSKLELKDENQQMDQQNQQQQQKPILRQIKYQDTQHKDVTPNYLSIKSVSQIYDPVLKNLYIMKKKFGSKYKQTIYTLKGTSITNDQFQRSKNLIQVMKYYNVKQKRIIVNQNLQNSKVSGQFFDNQKQGKQKQKWLQQLIQQQRSYYENKYPLLKSTLQQLSFCIIIPSYQNHKTYFRNLNSILIQQYTNYHIVYIDDGSNDGTASDVKQYIKKNQLPKTKIKLIQNLQNKNALSNIYFAAHNFCKDKEIMLIVDGDDYLVGTQVLRFLNHQYQAKGLLAAYTNYLRIHTPYYTKVGTSTPYPQSVIRQANYRKNPKNFRASHLRSYFVQLFRKIKIQDLQDKQGKFFSAANDFAIMMPVLQMAGSHFKYLPQITYLYDSGTGLNNFQSKVKQQANNVKLVSDRSKYQKIQFSEIFPNLNDKE